MKNERKKEKKTPYIPIAKARGFTALSDKGCLALSALGEEGNVYARGCFAKRPAGVNILEG